ncbi:DNA-3-methyladenine glycosylase [Raphidocelis subcapitata]|uniref:DNA-3-methyladenine glycosylase n=1 Tax=Raphidocelis subcapitata TaxID=307507 RepID=A0A2V0NUK8_9CHLO|nr:DNA-3-methyladenine glycosylase [Raphidocelis subcapitata]|eukprot:GBF91311.1 DNA-3-methyladenine glycosylase [Raphidocelis subcapitata]
MTPTEILLHHVCPGVGSLIAFFMFGAPLPAVLEVRRRRYIGETNALPFAAMGANCMAWLFYGFLIRDWYVYIPNFVGLMFGWFFTFTCFKFSTDKAQDSLTAIILSTLGLYFVIGIVHQAANLQFAAAKTLWGSTAVGVLGLYYTAPLTTILTVLRARDSASLNGPLSTMNVLNGALWFAYGMAIKDWFIALPNGIGAAFNVICKRGAGVTGALRDMPTAAAGGAHLVRLQSAHFDPMPLHQPPAARGRLGSFFDLAQMRWRSGADAGAAGAGAARGGRALAGGFGGSTNSLKWLPPGDSTIAESSDDVESAPEAAPASGEGEGAAAAGAGAGAGGGGAKAAEADKGLRIQASAPAAAADEGAAGEAAAEEKAAGAEGAAAGASEGQRGGKKGKGGGKGK